MWRLRLLRVVLPLVIVAFVAALALTFRSRPPQGTTPTTVSDETGARMEGFRFSDLVGGRRRLLVQARVGRVDDQGAFDIEDVERVEVDREGQAPLVLTATRGAGSGSQGKRVVRLEGGVTVTDDDAGFSLRIPTVEVDQTTGVVRSVGDVVVEGVLWSGTASAVVYSLEGQPAQILSLAVRGPDGARLSAQRALVTPGARTLELEGAVEARQGATELLAERVTLVRGENGGLASASASPSVRGRIAGTTGAEASFAAREAGVTWRPDGTLAEFVLTGSAHVAHAKGTILAERIAAAARAGDDGFDITADGTVVATGGTTQGPGRLSCDQLRAHLDARGAVRDGVATGDVRFDGRDSAGEGGEATFTSLDPAGTVTLRTGGDRRARLADGRVRIAADAIVSDLRGTKLAAQGRVESTLLPAPQGRPGGGPPLFVSGEAVHFVSDFLDSIGGGARLVFRGGVRGWQGDRSLSADEVEMIQDGEVLLAKGKVATRMPRDAGASVTEADYVQVTAERLTYRGDARVAEYGGAVRVRQAEGWLEAPRLLATLGEAGRGVREVQALDGVQFEYRAPGSEGLPSTATGQGDRVIYETAGRSVRLFGDKSPATVRQSGPSGGTTVGRVLRYRLDTGAIEVESGERDRATIRTPKN